MTDFDGKLNQILSNPDAMAQIARLAQSLNAPPEASGTQPGDAPPPGTSSGAAWPDSVANASRSDGVASVPPPDASAPSDAPPYDASFAARFLPLLQELGDDSNARRLLYALRPYLRPQKQEKVEHALRLARLFCVGKKFLSQWEG